MDINRANIEALFQDFKVAYTAAFNGEKERSVLDTLSMIVPSTTKAVVHAWLTQIPRMREWIGDRLVNNLESDNMTVTNKRYESTIEMEREEVEDDQHGLYRPLATAMGIEAAAHPDKLVTDEMVGDPNWLADAAAFFGTSRTYGSNTISNKTTTAFDETRFETAYQAMASYLGHNDDPLMVSPQWLLHGPALRTTVFDVLVNDMRASSSAAIQNRNVGLVKPVESKRLTGTYANYWFLLGEVAGIKGSVYQQRMPAEFQDTRTRSDSDFVFETDKFQWGVRARGKAFLSLPHLIYAGYVAA